MKIMLIRSVMRFTTSIVFILVLARTYGQITPHEAAILMGKGINMGNTLDALPTEGSWYPKKAEKYYFAAYKEAGFNNVRIPVTWQEHFENSPGYKVQKDWMDRIDTIVGWALEAGLIVTLNAHHDNWIKHNYTPENIAKFDSLWTQIAYRFKDKPDRLLFEILNEAEKMTVSQLNETQARVLKIIRKTNPTRIVLFSGNGWNTSDNLIAIDIPDTNDQYLMGFFHAYDPWNFVTGTEPWYGTAANLQSMRNNMQKVKTWSEQNNIPVALNEWGAMHKCDYNQKMRYLALYGNIIRDYGFTYSYWDDGGDFRLYEREDNKWDDVKDVLIHFTNHSPTDFAAQARGDSIVLTWLNRIDTDSVAIDSTVIQRKTERIGPFNYHATVLDGQNYVDTLNLEVAQIYYYRVVNYLANGDSLISYPQYVYLICSERFPFHGEPHPIPGIIQAEDFDIGCNQLTYFDKTPVNQPGAYRPNEMVDIEARTDGGYQIAYVEKDEWIEYTVNVVEAGDYNIISHVATERSPCRMSVRFNKGSKKFIDIPNTGSWQTNTQVYTQVSLNAGEQIMRVTIESENPFNIDKFEIVEGPVSVSKHHMAQFRLYPNPASYYVNFDWEGAVIGSHIELLNLSGELVLKHRVPADNFTLSTSALQPGFYIVRGFCGNSQVFSSKLIISK